MATLADNLGSLAFKRARYLRAPARNLRTQANRKAPLLRLAMQKVVGSSPIIRFVEGSSVRLGFLLLIAARTSALSHAV
jgi:hypothetical protein